VSIWVCESASLGCVNEDGTAAPRNAGVPWDGKAERLDVLLLAGISLSGIYALALLPLVPSLVGTHPVLLELLRGSMTAMVTMGALARIGDQSIVVAVLAAIPGLMLFDWIYWWAGKRWGRRVIDLFLGNHPKAVKRTAQLEKLTARYGWIAIDLLGSLLWIGLCVGLGYAIGQSAVDVAKGVSHYALYLTIALVVAVFVRQAWVANRQQSRAPRPD
jgi:membrane-associated protein